MMRFCSGVAIAALVSACSAGGGDEGNGNGTLPVGAGGMAGFGGGSVGGYMNPGSTPGVGNSQQVDPGPLVGGADRGSEERCEAIVTRGEKAPLDIYIMYDQSLSMNCAVANNQTRWDVVKQAMDAFVHDTTLSGVSVGIQYFGRSLQDTECDPAVYEAPDVEVGLLPTNSQPLMDSLNRHRPVSNTPTIPALGGAINHAVDWRNAHASHTTVVVLVTDGQPNSCGAVADVANVAATGLSQMQMKTYVIGVISPGIECPGIDPNPPNQADLDTVAVAGGTENALMVDATQNGAQQFAQRLDQIRGSAQVPCQYQIPAPKAGETFNPQLVNVQFQDAVNKTDIFYVDNLAACGPGGGWYYDNPTLPTQILLCPNSCTVATTQVGITVDIALGCDRIQVTE